MYYVGNIPVLESDIKHWGVLGMKWGIRRYQNPDGTLTEAGKKRYGSTGKYEYKSIGQKFKASQLAKDEAKGIPKKAQKHKEQLEAYKKRDADRQKYAEKTSGLKAGVQKGLKILTDGLLMPSGIDVQYQRARSRGEGRAKSILTSRSMMMSVGSLIGALATGGASMKSLDRIIDSALNDKITEQEVYNEIFKFANKVAKGATAGAVAGYAGSKVHTMNENKKKYGHRMWT